MNKGFSLEVTKKSWLQHRAEKNQIGTAENLLCPWQTGGTGLYCFVCRTMGAWGLRHTGRKPGNKRLHTNPCSLHGPQPSILMHEKHPAQRETDKTHLTQETSSYSGRGRYHPLNHETKAAKMVLVELSETFSQRNHHDHGFLLLFNVWSFFVSCFLCFIFVVLHVVKN